MKKGKSLNKASRISTGKSFERKSNQDGHRYVVVGGAGAMGRITVKDLMMSLSEKDEIVVADFDPIKAQKVVDDLRKGNNVKATVTVRPLDIRQKQQSRIVLAGAFVVINAIQYQMNLDVMAACLDVGAHYVDMGGLFHMTRKQMQLNEKFKQKKLIAVLGMGAAPGITNLLARWCADQLDSVTEIHTRVAGYDGTTYKNAPALPVAYSLKTILEEFSFEPAVFTKGEFKFVKPMSGDVPHAFPAPVGVRRPMFTIHSEVATLPLSYAKKGVKEVTFKIAFDEEFLDRVRFLRDLGFSSHQEIKVGDSVVKPIDVVNTIAMTQKAATQVGPLKQYEIVRAVVKGKMAGKKCTLIADCHTQGLPEWGFGIDVDTGCPPSVVAQMIAHGDITETGALPAEQCVPVDIFFGHLQDRKMKTKLQKKSGWDFKV